MFGAASRLFQFPLFFGLIIAVPQMSVAVDTDSGIDERLKKISKSYSEESWIEKPKFRPHGYMRPVDGDGWQIRMLALHAVVKQGKSAIPRLVEALETGDDAQRIFAAQALGYFGSEAPVKPLLHAARADKAAAVRLYAVDSLGMRGNAVGRVDWAALRKQERDRDVLKHIGYAKERKNAAVEIAVVNQLKSWNPTSINSAVVGKPAPDFELLSANQQKVKLGSFRGKKSVVLVFIYGDT